MRVDFYQLSHDSAEQAVVKLTEKATSTGASVLVIAADAGQRQAISDALWTFEKPAGPTFLAHGMAGEAHEARQPILLSPACEPANGASLAIVADGTWREELSGFERVLLMFDSTARDAAAALWRRFRDDSAVDNRIFKQGEDRRWREGG